MIINCALWHEAFMKYNIEEVSPFMRYDFLALRLGKFCRKYNLPFGRNVNNTVVNILDDTIIFFDAGIKRGDRILDIVAQANQNKRLIFYYWNPVRYSILPCHIPDVYEKWTYSYSDSLMYALRYNPTFYCTRRYQANEFNNRKKWDILFVGKDKNRKKQLNKWKKVFENIGLTVRFYITASHPRVQKWGYEKFIPYDQVLELVSASGCLFDLYNDKTAGPSLRVMEALFFEKKLITNNIAITSNDFYDPNNIFILGIDDINKLYDFVNSPYKKLDPQIITEFEFESWMNRF